MKNITDPIEMLKEIEAYLTFRLLGDTPKVNFIIEVPDNIFCWSKIESTLCQYFDNEGGHSKCELGFYNLKDSVDGVLKPKECLNLKWA